MAFQVTQKHIILFFLFVAILYIVTFKIGANAKYVVSEEGQELDLDTDTSSKSKSTLKEMFSNLWYYNPFRTHTNFLWWNTQLGSTRNMSYDLRGDVPIYPRFRHFQPWNNPTRFPIYNKPLIV
jgi:hypothetical protein